MEDWTQLFDVIVLKSAGYPITIWNLVVDPSAVFQQPTDARICSAGLTYIFTAVICYALYSARESMGALLSDQSQGSSHERNGTLFLFSSKMTPSVFISLMIAFVAIIVNVQQYALSKLFDVRNSNLETQLGALVYAVCPVYLLGTFFTEIANQVRRKSDTPIIVVLCNFLYIWCLYNVSATAFNLPVRRSKTRS
jgi:uncharacterized membrane protein YhaH (DUF805 family)